MSVEQKVGQLLIAGIEGTNPGDDALVAVQDYQVGGMILFGRNVEGAAQLTGQVRADWEAHRLYFHVVARHSDADGIAKGFRAVEEYLALEEADQYNAANADLMAQLALIAEMEQPSWINVL